MELQDVAFRFSDEENNLFQNINFVIRENESVALIGETGAGKTTLADIILGLRKPTAGNILVNDKNVLGHMEWWARQIGYVPQFIYLNNDTIRNNVCFFEEYDEAKLIDSLKAAQIWDFVKNLSQGVRYYCRRTRRAFIRWAKATVRYRPCVI